MLIKNAFVNINKTLTNKSSIFIMIPVTILLAFLIMTITINAYNSNSKRIITKDYITQRISIGMTKVEITNLFGEDFEEIEGEMNCLKYWRYDLKNCNNYSYKPLYPVQADFDGIKCGIIKYQLFVEWSPDNTVNHYFLYYSKGNKIWEYRVLPNLEVIETCIE